MTDRTAVDGEDAGFTLGGMSRRRTERPITELPALLFQTGRLVHDAAPRDLWISITLSVIAAVFTALQLLVISRVVEGIVQPSPSVADLIGPVSAFVALYVGASIASVFGAERQRVLAEMVARHSQSIVAEAACNAELVDFERPEFHNRLQRTLLNLGGRPVQVTNSFAGLLGSLATLAGSAIALAVVAPQLLLLVAVACLPLWIAMKFLGRLTFGFDVWQTEADRRRSYLLSLLVQKPHAKEIRAYRLAAHLRAMHSALWTTRIAELRRVSGRRSIAGAVSRALSGVIVGLVLLVLVWFVSSGRLTVPEASVAAGAVILLGRGLQAIASSIGVLYECSLFLRDAQAFIDAAHEPPASGVELAPFASLELDGVHFTYPASEHPALDGVSLRIDAGEIVAIVGENGSGKTTLGKLLAQLYEPSEGTVRWNGDEIPAGRRSSLRDQIAILFQDFDRYLFTARENIGFGRVEWLAELDQVADAARRSGADTFIEPLPGGYEHLLGPEFYGGTDLSGGQWQRVALARAFFRDAPVVILDEPTSALDPQAERDLFDRLRDLWAGRAVLVISHRFSTVTAADRIVVLDHGRVIEQGTHTELMRLDGRYAHMFRLQAEPYLDPER